MIGGQLLDLPLDWLGLLVPRLAVLGRHVSPVSSLVEILVTDLTVSLLEPFVSVNVFLERGFPGEVFPTEMTGPGSGVALMTLLHMSLKSSLRLKHFLTNLADLPSAPGFVLPLDFLLNFQQLEIELVVLLYGGVALHTEAALFLGDCLNVGLEDDLQDGLETVVPLGLPSQGDELLLLTVPLAHETFPIITVINSHFDMGDLSMA